jgi:hypothetical protein
MRPYPFGAILVLALLLSLAPPAVADGGRQLIEESVRRYALPAHVFEEQTWVLTDRAGKLSLRTTRHYARQDDAGSGRVWIVDAPIDARGASIQVARTTGSGNRLGTAANSPVFGSVFLVADIEGEQERDFRYERDGDQDLDRVPHHLVRAIPLNDAVVRHTGYFERRFYLRKDNLYVSRIEYRDREGRPWRQQTFRDPRPDSYGIWRPDMVLMEDLREGSRALLKVERRVHSADYVPAAVFAGLKGKP